MLLVHILGACGWWYKSLHNEPIRTTNSPHTITITLTAKVPIKSAGTIKPIIKKNTATKEGVLPSQNTQENTNETQKSQEAQENQWETVGGIAIAYPLESRKKGEEGRVVIEVTTNGKGYVIAYKILEKSQYERLNQAVIESVQGGYFDTKRNATWTIPVNFVLKK